LGKKTKSLSVDHPLGDRSDIQALTDEKLEELKPQLLAGNEEVIDEVFRGYIRLAISIAGKYAVFAPRLIDDLVSEAHLGLMIAIREIIAGKIKTCTMPAYIIARIHTFCSNYLNRDQIVGYSHQWKLKRKRLGLSELPNLVRHNFHLKRTKRQWYDYLWVINHPRVSVSNGHGKFELEEILELSAETETQQKILHLRLLGYNIREIAKELGTSKTTVSENLKIVRKKAKKFLEE
jgi:RNA polymerase sigma factor (sigma-70 family)